MHSGLVEFQCLLSKIASELPGAVGLIGADGKRLVENSLFSDLYPGDSDISFETLASAMSQVPLKDDTGNVVAYLVKSADAVLRAPCESGTPVDREPVDQFAVLNQLLARMLSYQKLDPLLQHIADVVIEITEANNALILLVDETEEYIDVVASAGSASIQNMGVRRKYGVGFAGIAWSTKTEQYLANSDTLDVTKGYWPPASQLVAVPLMSVDSVVGVAVLAAPAEYKSFRSSTSLVRHLASLAGIAIVNAKSREQSDLELSRMRALRKINSLLVAFENSTSLIQDVSRTLMLAMDISRAVYFMLEDDGVTEHADIWIKVDNTIVRGNSTYDDIVNEGLNEWCYENNAPAYLPRNHEDPRESVMVSKSRKESDIGSMFCVPITAKDRVAGVISISRDLSKRDFNESERSLFLSICSQISGALLNHELSVALTYQAYHDSLTSLPNRFCVEKELADELDQSAVDREGAIMFLDLDGFKLVNDSLGHHYGDELLRQVANRFKACIRENDTLARVGGDEFAIIARSLTCESDAVHMANKIIDSLSGKIEIDHAIVEIGVSIGISFYPQDGQCADVLIRNADVAMYRAKAHGKGVVACFCKSMIETALRRAELDVELREAITSNHLELYYQPQVNTETGEVSGVEALLRWNHPQRGFISPGEFIPVAEETGLINILGSWVLDKAIAQLEQWRGGLLGHIRIGVNVSANQFLQADFVEQLLSRLNKCDVSSSLLEIELTEGVMMNDTQAVIAILKQLRNVGVRVAVDDFGTGYSSLSYLQDLPLDVLKIDKSFVNHLEEKSKNHSVANTVVLMAKGLGLETVAEGVETAGQFERVKELGCGFVQGFYFARPCPASELPSIIESINRKTNPAKYVKAS